MNQLIWLEFLNAPIILFKSVIYRHRVTLTHEHDAVLFTLLGRDFVVSERECYVTSYVMMSELNSSTIFATQRWKSAKQSLR